MDDCIFCKIVRGDVPSAKVMENETTYAFLDIHPTNAYHTLVIPKNHYENVFDTPVGELQSVISMIKEIGALYKEKLGIENVQIINSSGREAQQDVFHLHFHIVPRHTDDGQDVHWTTHPEMQSDFADMLSKLK